MLKSGDSFPDFSISDHLLQQKVKIPTTYGKAPTRSAGRCSPRGGALATPALYPALFSTPRFTCTFWGRRFSLFRHTAAQGGVSVGRGRDAALSGRAAHRGLAVAHSGGTRARAAPHRERPLTHPATPSAASRSEQVPASDAVPATAGCTPLPSGCGQRRR